MIECPICRADVRKSSLKGHQRRGACRVAAMKSSASKQGLVASWGMVSEWCRRLGIHVEHGPAGHHQGGWGSRAHTSEADYVPAWADLIMRVTDVEENDVSMRDRVTVLALVAGDEVLCDALVAASYADPRRREYGEYPPAVRDMVLSLVPSAREQVKLSEASNLALDDVRDCLGVPVGDEG
jgi:hypothetical protein